ncbi:DNA helicase [Tanacetum coccineum]
MRGDIDGSDVGLRIISPQSFTGGPRCMYAYYLDALAIYMVTHFFVTFTCNVNWPEIKLYTESFPELTVTNSPDIVDRVIERKVWDYIKFLRSERTFDDMTAEAIKVHRDEDVDKYIFAELPDQTEDSKGYKVVYEFMVHRPCGMVNQSAPCTDHVVAHNTRPVADCSPSDSSSKNQIDEIKNHLDAQFVGPHEACWRILGFDLHSHEPAVQVLAVQLQYMQRVSFRTAYHDTAAQLRSLFVQILVLCEVTDLVSLWEKIWEQMYDDISNRLSTTLSIREVHKNEEEMKGDALCDITKILNSYSKTLKNFGLVVPSERLLKKLWTKLLIEEKNTRS